MCYLLYVLLNFNIALALFWKDTRVFFKNYFIVFQFAGKVRFVVFLNP